MLKVLQPVLEDLRQTLTPLPDATPLALLLEVDSGLSDSTLQRVWREAWNVCGIRQSTVPVEGHGLAAVDQWLDQRINDQALLMVVAAQFAPEQVEGTAEAAVGLLFGNRLTQTTLAPIAYLHRPEQERTPTGADLLYAARQALDWVPLPAPSIEQVWRVGIDAQRRVDLATVSADVPSASQARSRDCATSMIGWAIPGKPHPGWRSPPRRRRLNAVPERNSFSAVAMSLPDSGARC